MRGLNLAQIHEEPYMLSGLSEIADNYSGFIVDLWGVVHNGQRLFDTVIPCLQKLKDMDKTVVFLSNAPRVSGVVEEQLTSFGLPREVYTGIITSGDVTLDYLRRQSASSYYHIGCPEKDSSLLAGIGMNPATQMFDAEIIIASNFDVTKPVIEDYYKDFDRAIANEIPMLCANPDLLVYRGDTKFLCAGTLAVEYVKRGGNVHFFGKPHASVYNYLFEKHSSDTWIAIGDAMETDIKGANNVGIDSILVLSGIHQEDKDVHNKYDATPTFISSNLIW